MSFWNETENYFRLDASESFLPLTERSHGGRIRNFVTEIIRKVNISIHFIWASIKKGRPLCWKFWEILPTVQMKISKMNCYAEGCFISFINPYTEKRINVFNIIVMKLRPVMKHKADFKVFQLLQLHSRRERENKKINEWLKKILNRSGEGFLILCEVSHFTIRPDDHEIRV